MAEYTLYGWPNTASTGIHWLLAELAAQGVTYTFVDVNLPEKQQKQDQYMALNPKGRVPTLIIDGVPISETGAIALLLAERHPDAHLSPPPGAPDRAKFLETHIFVVNSLLPALRDWFYADKDQPDETIAHGIRCLTLERLKSIYALIDAQLGARTYLTNDHHPTATDFIFTATLSWNGFIDAVAAKYPHLKRYRDHMRARPTWKEIVDKEKIELTMRPFEEQFLARL